MSDKINKALHGVIQPGSCWHEWIDTRNRNGICQKVCQCGKIYGYGSINKSNGYGNQNYFSKEGFWDALAYAMKQKWWFKFNGEFFLPAYIKVELVDYKTFAKHLHDFLVEEGIIKGDG